VVEHELGHVLGLDDLGAASGDVMDAALAEVVRRLPGPADVDASFTAPPAPIAPGQPPAQSRGLGVATTDTAHQQGRRLRHPRGRVTRRTLRAHAAKVAGRANRPSAL
jgi:hypothetical protein